MATREGKRTPVYRRDRSTAPLVILLLVAVAAAAAVWMWVAGDEDDSAGPERGVTVEDVAHDDAFDDDGFAGSLLGQEVTVSGNVSAVIGTSAVRLGGDDFGGDGLLVINVNRAGGAIAEDDNVRVTGTVREYDEVMFAREFGSEFEDDVYDPWFDENVLVASSVTPLDEDDG